MKQLLNCTGGNVKWKSTFVKGRLVDKVRVYVRGGGGGQGSPKIGGCGGDGGNVLVVARRSSLTELARREHRRFVGGNGQNASAHVLNGKRGSDTIIGVPPGTAVVNDSGRVMCDLDRMGEKYTLARGGTGGSYHTSNWSGSKGNSTVVNFVLKLIADIGLLGFPNAGKSTLLGKISNTAPKVADYPFTTLRPHLGHVAMKRIGQQIEQFSVVDLPGLVEGAHQNVGMGHRFLRHIERTKALIYVVDINGFQLSERHPFRSALETVQLLHKELQYYQEALCERPSILAVNKMDTKDSKEKYDDLKASLEQNKMMSTFRYMLPMSALNGDGIEELKIAAYSILEELGTLDTNNDQNLQYTTQ